MIRQLPSSSRSSIHRRARLAGAMAAAGALFLLAPGVAAAATPHHALAAITAPVPPVAGIFSFFTSIFSGIGDFFKSVVTGIFGAFMGALLGKDFKFVEHPELVINWLVSLPDVSQITGIQITAGTETANASTPFTALGHITQACGIVLLGLSVNAAVLRLLGAGVFGRPTDHLHDFGRILTTACIILAWPWLFSEAIALVNTIVNSLIVAANVNGNLGKTAGAYIAAAVAGGGADILTDFIVLGMIGLVIGMLIMKVIMLVIFGILFVAGPLALAFYPFQALSRIVGLFLSLLAAVALVPIGWSIIFDCFAAFGATLTAGTSAVGIGSDVLNALASLACFYLAFKWPIIIISRASGMIGGQVAEVGAALNSLSAGRRAGAASGAAGGAATTSRVAAARAALGAGSGTFAHGVGQGASAIPGYGIARRGGRGLATGAAKAGRVMEDRGLSGAVKAGGAASWGALKQGGRNFNAARQNPVTAGSALLAAGGTAAQAKFAALEGAAKATPGATAAAARVATEAAMSPPANAKRGGPSAEQQGLDHGRQQIDSAIDGIRSSSRTGAPGQGSSAAGGAHPGGSFLAGRTPVKTDTGKMHGPQPRREPAWKGGSPSGSAAASPSGNATGNGGSSGGQAGGNPDSGSGSGSGQQRMQFAGQPNTGTATPPNTATATPPVRTPQPVGTNAGAPSAAHRAVPASGGGSNGASSSGSGSQGSGPASAARRPTPPPTPAARPASPRPATPARQPTPPTPPAAPEQNRDSSVGHGHQPIDTRSDLT